MSSHRMVLKPSLGGRRQLVPLQRHFPWSYSIRSGFSASAGIATEVKKATDRIQIPYSLLPECAAIDTGGRTITFLWLQVQWLKRAKFWYWKPRIQMLAKPCSLEDYRATFFFFSPLPLSFLEILRAVWLVLVSLQPQRPSPQACLPCTTAPMAIL